MECTKRIYHILLEKLRRRKRIALATECAPDGSVVKRLSEPGEAPGERACLVGRNGSGKSTLLKIAAGLMEADRGIAFCSVTDPHTRRTWSVRRSSSAVRSRPSISPTGTSGRSTGAVRSRPSRTQENAKLTASTRNGAQRVTA